MVRLKKQTQFPKGQNDVKSVITMVYGEFDDFRQRKNKANSKLILIADRAEIGVRAVSEMYWEETMPAVWVSDPEPNRMDVNISRKLEISAKTWYFIGN